MENTSYIAYIYIKLQKEEITQAKSLAKQQEKVYVTYQQ